MSNLVAYVLERYAEASQIHPESAVTGDKPV